MVLHAVPIVHAYIVASEAHLRSDSCMVVLAHSNDAMAEQDSWTAASCIMQKLNFENWVT